MQNFTTPKKDYMMNKKEKYHILQFVFRVDHEDFIIMIFVGILKCFVSVFGLYVTKWLFEGVQELSSYNNADIIIRILLYSIYIFFMASFNFFYTRYYIQFCAIPNFEKKIMEVLFDKTQKISNDEFERSDILRVIRQANGARQALFRYAEIWINIFSAFLQVIFVALNISYFSGWYLLFLPFSFLSSLLNQFYNDRLWKKEIKTISQLEREQAEYEKAMFGDTAAKESRTSFAKDILKEKWIESRKQKVVIENTRLKKQVRFKILTIVLEIIGRSSCTILSAVLMYYSIIDFGIFTASVAAYQTIQTGIEQLLSMNGYRKQYGLMLQSFFEFMSLGQRNGNDTLAETTNNIVMKDVSFFYPGQTRPALKNINLSLKKGETLAIVGENGSGKSTLVKLLLGLYIPSHGKVIYSDVDISSVKEDLLHINQSAVFQDFVRYHMSLKENIFISADESKNSTYTQNAIKQFCCENKIEKEKMLGKEFGGIELSGGQWQKIACMRGFNKDCAVLVLDEPTSAIDPLKESEMYEEFKNNLKDRFGIIVTHRLGGVRLADRIIVLSDGCLIEEGTHEELLKMGGLYAKMWKEQAGAYMM